MRRFCVIVPLLLVAVCAAVAVPAVARASDRVWRPNLLPGAERLVPPHTDLSRSRASVPGQLLVEFRSGTRAAGMTATVQDAGALISRRLVGNASPSGGRVVLVSSAVRTTAELAAAFRDDPSVARVSPNYVRRLDALPPDDPGLSEQWGIADVRAGDAWQSTTGSGDVVIASVDTGVDLLHPDLVQNLWHNPGEIPGNGVDDDGNGYVDDVYGIDTAYHDSVPMDDYGHGTHTMGIAAAVGDNGVGVAGVGWHTKIMALKFLDADGGGTDAQAIECIDYIVREKLDYGVNVVAINASWGGFASNPLLKEAIERAGDAGIVFCASAGNTRSNNDRWPHYPSTYDSPNILSVAASSPRGGLAWFSCYGLHSVDLAAPGEDILSTLPGGYGSWSGTSMATPFVTGTVALLAAEHPGDSVRRRIARVLTSVRRESSYAGRMVTGGTLDTAAALGWSGGTGDSSAPVTTALGVDGATHDVAVSLTLFATDGPGGSGVASTQYRIDGGAWKTGDVLLVPAPRRARVTQVVEYRSTDAAGNVEQTRSATLAFDTTTAGRDDRRPGVALPPSPVAGGVDGDDFLDVFRVRLRAGETFHAWTDGEPTGGVGIELIKAPARSRADLVGMWEPATTASTAWVAPRDGVYYLVVLDISFSFDDDLPQPYRFEYEVLPVGVDAVPPSVHLEGYSWAWRNKPLTVTLTASDGSGSGVAAIEVSHDDGLTWVPGSSILVEAPADHSNDGAHLIRCRAVDVAGNVSQPIVRSVHIDTQGPVTQAWGPVRAVRRGRVALVRYRVEDLSPFVRVQLIVQSAATGRVVWRDSVRGRPTSAVMWWDPDYRFPEPVPCDWPAGRYVVRVAGHTRDLAGNRWSIATCEREIVVK
jgi:thermitase